MILNKRTITIILLCCIFSVLSVFPLGASDEIQLISSRPCSTEHPNIVLILIDALRADKLSCYGFPESTSPELDALAAKGVRFQFVVAQCSWTRPSVASLLTSYYPRTLGLYKEKNEALNSKHVTLAQVLKSHGYTTLGGTANPVINSVYGMDQGFCSYTDSSVVYSWMKDDLKGKEIQKTRGRGRLPAATDVFKTILEQLKTKGAPPYYVQALLMEVHEAWRGRKSLTREEYRHQFRGQNNPDYLCALKQVSHDIDIFLRELFALPGWEDTLVIITSDHGQGLRDHPNVAMSSAHGRLLYESQVRVPLILYRSNGSLDSRVVERPVRLLDVMPTILSYLNIPVPGQTQGVSLVPLLNNPDASVPLPEFLITETNYRNYEKTAVYSKDWKYIENRDNHRGTNPRELQRIGVRENGKRTDDILNHPDIAEIMGSYLRTWDAEHPKATPTSCSTTLSQEEEEQMKAIGYLQ